jgi:mannitol-1-phosphate/altronate dehydrogenase
MKENYNEKKNDVRDRIMKEVFQKNVQKKKKQLEKKKKRSRFVFDKEKNKITKMIKKMKKIQEIASLSARKRVSNKLRIIDI